MAINEKSLQNLKPGARKGKRGGRTKCIETLDKMLRNAGNQKILLEKLQESFEGDPLAFLLKFVYPVLPKDVNLEVTGKDGGAIQIINVIPPKKTNEQSD